MRCRGTQINLSNSNRALDNRITVPSRDRRRSIDVRDAITRQEQKRHLSHGVWGYVVGLRSDHPADTAAGSGEINGYLPL